MKNAIYLSPSDYEYYLTKSGGKTIFVDIKGFILRAEREQTLKDGEVGLSKFHRESLKISKMDDFEVKIAKIKDKNPMNAVEIVVESLLYKDNDMTDLDN